MSALIKRYYFVVDLLIRVLKSFISLFAGDPILLSLSVFVEFAESTRIFGQFLMASFASIRVCFFVLKIVLYQLNLKIYLL